MKLIVTAGGQGKKIWPLSRESKPKQFQAVVGNVPLYQQTIETLLKAFSADDIYISTKKRYYDIAREQSPQISPSNFILEPDIAKDRGPGEGLAFVNLAIKHPNEPFMIIQPDCLRLPEEAFISTIIEAEKIERRDKKFMSGGIKANYPVLGVDYLRLGDEISSDSNLEVYKVDEFIQRNNDYHQTKKLIENFHVSTHSNHNCWYPELMLEAYKQYRPDWYADLMKIQDVVTRGGSESEIDTIYGQMEAGPTELVTNQVFPTGYAILLPFKWTDIGTWDSVYEFFDEEGKVHVDGQASVSKSQTSLIKCDNENKLIAVYGIENLVVIDTKDVLLIVPKDKSNNVSNIVKSLKENNQTKYL